MNRYNRQNPFMYLVETKEMELMQKSKKVVSDMIILFIVGVLAIITFIINQIIAYDKYLWFEVFFILTISLFIFLAVKHCVKTIDAKGINELIFGDEYKDINLNNEKLLVIINKYHIAIGRVEVIGELITYCHIIFVLSMIINVICIINKFL